MSDATRSDFHAEAEDLLNALGYKSERKLDYDGTYDDFISEYDPERFNPETQAARSLKDAVKSIKDVFQVTTEEIAENAEPVQGDLGILSDTDVGRAESFLFVSAILKGDSYPRGQYAAFTRVINRINEDWPTVVLFQTAANLVSLAFINRRQNKRDAERDVLGSVSLIREINPSKPHHAHVKILEDLSLAKRLSWMKSRDRRANFDGLLSAWLNALDTEELNKRFYDELFGWFQRAVAEAKFPKTGSRAQSPEEHVIRLITRLMFVWFIKEKGLVADDLFIETQVSKKLKDYDAEKGDSYYRAVLQNLFFATLNTEIDERRVFNHYRYKSEMSDPDGLEALFSRTPFINGGLFDCLDSEEATDDGGYWIDCFTDDPNHRRGFSIPNRLFFGESTDSLGLILLFEKYKFTVEENTPVEQEVALDPELLGKVFENLLAAYNPETRETARKQTGSYYTPRAVVDYMVDEALVASLAQNAKPADGDADFWERRLRYLMDYDDAFDDADELFTQQEREAIVRAISEIKILDPAVGSGAFPMGTLHKLTLVLGRLDPHNQIWEELQKELAGSRASDAFDTQDQAERDEELKEISETFEKYRDSDFGRKLYLIQNSIYGVDIQPVATQIAKLRFFISLAIEQTPDSAAPNYGVKPLPNLETRFVAANTLIALGQATQIPLGGRNRVTELNDELRQNREQHFHAGVRREKLRFRREDARLRRELATELGKVGMSKSDAGKIAGWDPYDQNASADWFDAKYMFSISNGFDVVIGNPPYSQVRKGTYSSAQFPYSEGRDKGKQNLYKLFVEQSYNLCKVNGLATMIVANNLMCDLSSAATRQLLLNLTQLHHVVEFPERAQSKEAQVFSSVTQSTCIYQFRKGIPDGKPIAISINNDTHTIAHLQFSHITMKEIESLYPDLRYFPRINQGDVSILQKIAASDAIRPLKHYASNIAQGDFNLTTHKKKILRHPTPILLLRGRNVSRYAIAYQDSTEYCEKGFMADKVVANSRDTFLISQEVMNQQAKRRLNFALTSQSSRQFLWGHSVNKTQLKDQTQSKAFLGLLNSAFMDWYFRLTSSNTHVQGYELEMLPIPSMSMTDSQQLARLADRILTAKSADPDAYTDAFEREIDRLVYDLYGLTEEEDTAIERSLGLIHATDEEEDAAILKAMLDGREEARAKGYASREEVMAILAGSDGD